VAVAGGPAEEDRVKRLWTWIVTPLVASRVTWLALVFVAFDLSIAAWINGVRAFRTSASTSSWLSILASIAVFIVACALLALFIQLAIPRR
jgi:hypothetical protein